MNKLAMILLVVCLTACTRHGGQRKVPADSCTYEHTGNTHQYAIPTCVGYDTRTGACNATIYIPQTEYE